MIDETAPICYRLRNNDDNPFVYASWLSGEKNYTAAKLTPPTLYQAEQQKKISYLLNKSNCMVAHLDPEPNQPQTLLAYIVYQYQDEHIIIHYSFTKSVFRQTHIQSNLLSLINVPDFPIILTCQPEPHILHNLQKTHNIFYDHYYFQRNSYV